MRPARWFARTRRRVNRLDHELLARATGTRSPNLDTLMAAASTAANRSRLWLVLAAGLAVLGGGRGRRAAERGVLAVGMTSAVVNGPLKLLLPRRRPTTVRVGPVRMPRSSSFPSGHAASAFAFATGVALEWPAVGLPLFAPAGLVAYSRVHNGVHYPSDVLVGAGIGLAAGEAAKLLLRDDHRVQLPPPLDATIPKRVVVLHSADSGRAEDYARAMDTLRERGFEIVEEIAVAENARLAEVVARPAGERPLVVAAGGDGTVGAAADQLAGTEAVMAIVPLGTSNDVARSMGISPEPITAAREIPDGVVRAVDVGEVVVGGKPTRHFVHAATVGFNVRFAQLATQSSLRRRFGRLTYAVAGIRAMRQHQPFDCELEVDGERRSFRLVQLSVINAPVFGGALDLRVPGARLDDRSLVIIAVEEGSAARLVAGALMTMIGRRRAAAGVYAIRSHRLTVHVPHPVDVAVDGEISSSLPADFTVAADALRVVTPRLRHDLAP